MKNLRVVSPRLISIKIRLLMTTFHNNLDGLMLKDTWLAIGSFDGVHLGHRDLIHRMVEGARAENCQSVVMTLYPAPQPGGTWLDHSHISVHF